ncbi:MAG: CAP domain-containing protein [Acidobacteriota bacterium]
MGFGQMFGDPAAVAAAWRAGAPSTFEALAARELKDFGFGVGSDLGVPSYVLAAGVSMGDVLADAAADLDDVTAVRRSVLDDVNEARRSEGLAEMWGSADLDRVAQAYADDMWRRGYYGHDSPEGENVRDRVRRARLLVQRVGENVASGQPRADEVMRGWLNSPPHRANILHEDFNALGTGVAAGYRDDGRYEIRWVQVFALIPR